MLATIKKYLNNTATATELESLENWVALDEKNSKIFREQIELHLKREKIGAIEFDIDAAFKNVDSKVEKSIFKKISFSIYKYAAVVLLLVCSGFLYNMYVKPNVKKQANSIINSTTTHNQVTLKFADGSIHVIDNVANKNEYGELSYSNQKDKKATLEYQEISIPKGKKFKLVLSDNSIVWLNANSTLTFPKNFIKTEKTRNVQLSGEAFFEVTKNAEQPFIVKTNDIDVEVLGTKFNVSSYKTDNDVKTTLVEGAVKVYQTDDKSNTLKLNPGSQASFKKSDDVLTKQKVDVQSYIAWLDDKLIFHKEPMASLLQKIERTYDVTITNNYAAINTQEFSGEFDSETINDVLNTLAESIDFEYTITNQNQITIRKN